ncbi:hypothetical protein RCL1_007191 [Eukaryota sp. TZLM3-RCL]
MSDCDFVDLFFANFDNHTDPHSLMSLVENSAREFLLFFSLQLSQENVPPSFPSHVILSSILLALSRVNKPLLHLSSLSLPLTIHFSMYSELEETSVLHFVSTVYKFISLDLISFSRFKNEISELIYFLISLSPSLVFNNDFVKLLTTDDDVELSMSQYDDCLMSAGVLVYKLTLLDFQNQSKVIEESSELIGQLLTLYLSSNRLNFLMLFLNDLIISDLNLISNYLDTLCYLPNSDLQSIMIKDIRKWFKNLSNEHQSKLQHLIDSPFYFFFYE